MPPETNPFEQELQKRSLPSVPNPFESELRTRLQRKPGLSRQFLRGFNNSVAELLGLSGAGAANTILGPIGQKLIGGEVKTKDATKKVKEGMKALGINTDPVDTVMGKLGANTLNALVVASSLGTAAPGMAALRGGTVTSNILKELGKIIQSRPDVFIAGEIAGSAGSTIGEKVGGTPGAIIGGLSGAVVGTGTVGAARRAAGAVGRIGARVPPATGAPLRTTGAGAEGFSEEISSGVLRAQQRVENTVARVLGRLEGPVAETQQITARRELENARDVAKRLERFVWNKVPSRGVPSKSLRDFALTMSKNIPDVPNKPLPEEYINWILGKTKGGKFLSSKTLVALRGRITNSIYKTDDKALKNNLIRLRSAVDSTIQWDTPDNAAINYAKEISKRVHDLFFTGPVSRILATRPTGEPKVASRLTIERLLRDPGEPTGIQQLKKISTDMRRPAVIDESAKAVKAMFLEAAEDSPKSAAKFIASNEKVIKDLAPLHAELKGTSELLTKLTQRSMEIDKSIFTKLAGVDPQVAVQRIFNNANPKAVADEIILQLRDRPESVESLRNGVLDELLKRAGSTGTGMEAVLANPKYDRLLATVLSDSQYNRLSRIMHSAAAGERGDIPFPKTLLRMVMSIGSRVTGAQLGRAVARHTGGGTVQTPGIFSRLFNEMAEGAMRGIPPNELIRRAITDPMWEKVLLMRAPTNAREMQRLIKQMRRLVVSIEATGKSLNKIEF